MVSRILDDSCGGVTRTLVIENRASNGIHAYEPREGFLARTKGLPKSSPKEQLYNRRLEQPPLTATVNRIHLQPCIFMSPYKSAYPLFFILTNQILPPQLNQSPIASASKKTIDGDLWSTFL